MNSGNSVSQFFGGKSHIFPMGVGGGFNCGQGNEATKVRKEEVGNGIEEKKEQNRRKEGSR